jgi:hypothetical protein
MPLLSWIASGLDKWLPARQGRAQCSCGAIQIDLHVPGSSYGLIDQSTGLCHCKDCVGFLKALGAQGEAFLRNNASQVVLFYPSDLTIVRGSDKVAAMRLRPDTPTLRFYCRECKTPLGVQAPSPVPVSSLYSQLLTSSDESNEDGNHNRFPVIVPFLVLNYDSALPGTRPYAGCAVVKRGMLAPLHILRTVGRILLGFAFGKTGSGLLPAQVDPRSAPVGVESITASKTKDQ